MTPGFSLSEYNELVDLVYHGVDEDIPWKSFVDKITEQTFSRDASLIFSCPYSADSEFFLVSSEDGLDLSREDLQEIMSVSTFMIFANAKPTTVEDVVSRESFLSSELYLKYLKPINVSYILGQDIYDNDGLHIRLGIERTEDQQQFTQREKEILGLITPHFRRAIKFRSRLKEGSYFSPFFGKAMAKLGIGCVLLDGRGQVVSVNKRAKRLFNADCGLCVKGGKLLTENDVKWRDLNKAIDLVIAAHHNRCASQVGKVLRIGSKQSDAQLDVVVKPIVGDMFQDSAESLAAVIYISEYSRPHTHIDPDVLSKMYLFTKQEARLGVILAQGLSLSEAAEQLDLSINTVKTHLRGVYEKAGVNRQAELVAHLNSSAIRLL